VDPSVTANLRYEYKPPARDQVHITAGASDTSGDSDQDGLSDAAEAKYGTNPHSYDSDYDGIPDGVEVAIGTNPLDKEGDADHDGVSDAREIGFGTSPFDPDTDHDGIPDAVELERSHLLALIPTPATATDTDWDGDGIPNDIENMYGTNQLIPENLTPELQRLRDLDYERRLQLNPDPVQQAMVTTDLQRTLTPEQEAALSDAIFDRGIASADVIQRYSLAGQLQVIDGTPISPDLQAQYDQANADLVKALTERDLDAWIRYNDARGITLDQAAKDAFTSAGYDQLVADGAMLHSLGVDLTQLGDTKLAQSILAVEPGWADTWGVTGGVGTGGTTSTGPGAGTDASTPAAPSNPADAALDRMDAIVTPTSPTEPATAPTTPTAGTGSASSGDGSGNLSFLDDPVTPTIPSSSFVPDSTPTDVANAVGNVADQFGTSSDTRPGTSSAPVGVVTTNDDEFTITPVQPEGEPVVNTETGWTGVKVTEEDGTQYIILSDGTKVAPSSLYVPADSGDDTSGSDSGKDGSTDTGGADTGGTTGGADDDSYVAPDADVVTVPMTLSPVIARLVSTGVDPTTTTPSNPYVDDAVAPVTVSSGTVTLGVNLPMNPGVVDGGGEDSTLTVVGAAPPSFDPAGPDTVNPDDPLVGGGGEDINPGDFTPRPSAAMTALGDTGLTGTHLEAAPTLATGGMTLDATNPVHQSLLGEGPPDDGFTPDPPG